MMKDDFVKYITDNIKDHLSEDYEDAKVVVDDVVKFNETYLGLSLRRKATEAVPCMNLDMYYEMYENGEDLEEILTEMADVIERSSMSVDIDVLINYEKAKDHLMLRVCNASRNQDYLETMAHKKIEDLAITYGIVAGDDSFGYQIAAVKNDMLDGFGVTIDQLHEDAVKSSIKQFPPFLYNMADMVPAPGHTKNLLDEDKTIEKEPAMPPFYVLTNSESFEGASVLFYSEIMEKAAKIIGEDYIIIPSSTNEVLLLPDSTGHSLSDLREMIRSANDLSGTVSPNEILGYEPYHYDSKSKIFEKAESFIARTAKKEKLDVRITSAEEKLSRSVKTDKEREGINGERENTAL